MNTKEHDKYLRMKMNTVRVSVQLHEKFVQCTCKIYICVYVHMLAFFVINNSQIHEIADKMKIIFQFILFEMRFSLWFLSSRH